MAWQCIGMTGSVRRFRFPTGGECFYDTIVFSEINWNEVIYHLEQFVNCMNNSPNACAYPSYQELAQIQQTTNSSTGGTQSVNQVNGNSLQVQGAVPTTMMNQPMAYQPYIPYTLPAQCATVVVATAVTTPLSSETTPKKGALDTLKEIGVKTGKGYTNLVVGDDSSANRVEVV